MTAEDTDAFELRLFLEEICCNLCRFLHVTRDGAAPGRVRVDQEVYLGAPGLFADIRVQPPGQAAYFVEVKYGYDAERIVHSLARKFGPGTSAADSGDAAGGRVVLVADAHHHADWPGVELEVWDEPRLLGLIREQFGVEMDSISATDLLDVRDAIDLAKGRYAFGDAYTGGALDSSLLWHFGYWRLRELYERQSQAVGGGGGRAAKRSIVPPGLYQDVVVVMADLTSFSSYVRDTRDARVVRNCLTAFYSKARHQVLNSGGFLYQFLGDAVIGLWGTPDQPDGYVASALDCAVALSDVGNSVSNEWQRQIDRVQSAGGVHVGMAIGDLQVMSLRPYGRAHLGAVGDSINLTSRLMSVAESGEVVVSNMLYQRLPPGRQAGFTQLPPVQGKNVGLIKAWKLSLGHGWEPG